MDNKSCLNIGEPSSKAKYRYISDSGNSTVREIFEIVVL